MNSTTSNYKAVCLACGNVLSPVLARAASPRCIDCRGTHAPLRPELVERAQARQAR